MRGWDACRSAQRLTDHARNVVVLAQEEARRLKHDYVGSEHLLLALLGERAGLAARVLASMGITLGSARWHVMRMVGSGEDDSPSVIAFTPRAKRVIELALHEALDLSHNYIGTEHLLLGLIREDEAVAYRILRDFDADAQRVRTAVMGMLPGANRS